ncbi:hypothetical protein PIB30_094464 [Stylosanthes scabra]|uniref:Putative plant transposon protein domain-containing protein n=1 Tax=Stylosanthes scabra TaxID=79078 RepID=A0ABU6YU80_9FABA|nr:hypothetical protein [Stylosanthes scabra]
MQGNKDKQTLHFDPEIERTLHKVRKQSKFQKPIQEIPSEEVFEEVSANMAEEGDQRKTLGDFTVPTTTSYGSSIVRSTIEANNFELKPALIHLMLVRTKYVDANPNIAHRTRRGRAAAQDEAEREATSFDELVFDSRKHYERSKKMLSRDILHERCINFEGKQDFMEERLGALGWLFMYNDLTPINLTLVREFYSNFSSANQRRVFLRGKQIPITEDALNAFLPVTTPPPSKVEDAYEKNLVRKDIGALNTELAQGWQKMIVSNMQLLKHHTTFSMNMALLIYTLMEGGPIHLGRIINNSMYHATTGASDQRLPFPVLISRMALANEVPTFPEDRYMIIEGKDRFCSFGDWQREQKKARKGDILMQIYITLKLGKYIELYQVIQW